MKLEDKKLIAVLCSLIVLLSVVICLAVSVYRPDTAAKIEYITVTAVLQSTTQGQITEAAVTTQQSEYPTLATADENIQQTTIVNSEQTQSQVQQTETTAAVAADVSLMSNQELLDMLSVALSKTMSYTGNVTVHHVESFEANVTECTGGSVAKSVANTIVEMVVDPKDEALSFSGGKAIDSEGDSVTILLPQNGTFNLSLSNITSISGSTSGNNAVIKVSIIQEMVGLYDVPTANASAIGYLDINNFDTSILTITEASITYTGSTIEVHIRPDGYVDYASYAMPMHVVGAANAMGISGSATFDGKQSEIWEFNW